MKVKKKSRLKETEVEASGASRAFKAVLLGREEGSEEIEMRRFRVLPGGSTSLHRHEWGHLILVERGGGVVFSEADGKFKVEEGDSVYIPAGEEHQVLNPFPEEMEFICVVPSRGR